MNFLPILALVSAPAVTQPDPTQNCPLIGEIAASTLIAYSVGVPMAEMMEIADGDKLLIAIIMDAYDEPRYSTDEVIAEATFDFRNRWEHACFQELSN
jgi:hypothetical protein